MRDWQAPTPRILAAVAVVHAVLLALLLASTFVRDEEAPPLLGEEIFAAGLDDATVAALNLPPTAEPPVVKTPDPPPPEPPAPVPPEPEPPPPEPPAPMPPKPEPPKPEPVKIVVPKPEPPKPQPPKPQPPKVTKPTPKKTYRTAEDIKKSAHITATTTKPPPLTPLPTFDARSIAGNLQKGLEAVRIDSTPRTARAGRPGGSSDGGARDADNEKRWHAALSAELYRLWAQPTRGEVGGGNPTVRVTFRITADGQVVEARMVGASGVMPMDATIRQLLESLTALPGFKGFGLDGASRTVTVTFKLTT